ncbi:alpha/beta hydrolase fold protein [Catenulispora acidiphila DSM 44928]|uniref:Alpha/beta hydrolase fold protein n=1 Tax=Catenulispora acidiphila (strain DSM 44928 / JCM 14897 / NBRC 102108 / NRRL B-24433 / ID139908) TaxID=479433 RepID=C7Q6W1_CATAD|nr:alpha/beta hydrolase fold protein [Catenulispora acidiphila DSM 44928]
MNPRLATTDHVFTVPLDHDEPGGGTIDVFAREVVDPGRGGDVDGLPWLVFLQGGPGGKSPRPGASVPGWLGRVLETHRLLLLDQRGTGRSTPVTPAVARGFGSGEELARYLSLHRADSIVRDCEHIRRALCGDQPWETLGQSYGGFITMNYLSRYPEGLRACYVTGGIPGLTTTADDVYRNTYPRVAAKNAEFYDRYPEDRATVARIAEILTTRDVRLPDGDRLTVDRLRSLGLAFGMGDGYERIHWLLDEAFARPGELSDTFLLNVSLPTGFVENPLFTVMQEPCYGQGSTPTAWAAERIKAEHPAFAADANPLMFTGEMIYPWMFRDLRALRPFAEAAEILAARNDWPALYDPKRLADNRVPLAAAVYHDDMYVPADFSLRTLSGVGAARAWITNEWEHDGGNASGGSVLARLMDMVAGRA